MRNLLTDFSSSRIRMKVIYLIQIQLLIWKIAKVCELLLNFHSFSFETHYIS